MSTNVNEYGMTLRMQSDKNLNGYTLKIVLKSPFPYIQCKEKTIDDGVMLGMVPIQTQSGIIFPQYEYANYVVQQGDFDVPGVWQAKLFAELNNQKCSVSDWVPFTVEE